MKQPTDNIKRPHLHDIRTNNRARILQMVFKDKLISRQELAERLELTPASVSRTTKDLLAEGICIEAESPRDTGQRGRPNVALRINPDGGVLVAITVSSYARKISIVDVSGKRLHVKEIPLDIIRSAEATVAFVGDYVDELTSKGTLDKRQVIGAAFALPGSISLHTGFLTKSIFLEWPDFPIETRLFERLGCPVSVENIGDALCMDFLDYYSESEKAGLNLFLVHVAAGMGASVAIGGQIVQRLADEGWINDIVVTKEDAAKSEKVKLRDLASGQAVLDKLAKTVNDVSWPKSKNFLTQIEHAIQLLDDKSMHVSDALYSAGHTLGVNLVPLTIACAPESIVLAGPVANISAYADGVKEGYLQSARAIDISPSNIQVNSTSYLDASESLALREFFFSGAYSGATSGAN